MKQENVPQNASIDELYFLDDLDYEYMSEVKCKFTTLDIDLGNDKKLSLIITAKSFRGITVRAFMQ